MDVISYQKASKAKKELKRAQDRIGMNGTEQDLDIRDAYNNADERITELEKKNPEIELYNRVGEVSKHTMVNLNKHALRVSSLLNQSRYQLSNMIIDDFSDDSGIDKLKSINYSRNSESHIVEVEEGQVLAEIVTIVEELDTDPTQIAVSQAAPEQHMQLKLINFEDGTHDNTIVHDNKIELKRIGLYESSDLHSLTPRMLSNESLEGFVFASDYYLDRHPWRAFNRDLGDFWNTTALNNYLGYRFTNPEKVKKVTITARGDSTPERTPSSFVIQASHDTTNGTDGEWIDLSQFNNEIGWLSGESREFELDNNNYYLAYRILVLDAVRADYPSIAEVEFLGNIMKDLYAPKGAYQSDVIDLGENPKSISILEDEKSLVPVMTSYSDPEGLVFASDYYDHFSGSRYPWRAFNNDPSDFWNSKDLGNYIGYKFTEQKVITKVSITARSDSYPERTPSSFLIQGSNNSTNGSDGSWNDIQTIRDQINWILGETREFDINNKDNYIAYRLKVLNAIESDYPTIAELKFIGYGEVDLNDKAIDISVSSSTDNMNFSNYESVSTDGSVDSPLERYLKLKVELSSEGKIVKTLIHGFDEEESEFEENEFIKFKDSAASLKTSYSSPMEVDSAFVEEGTLLASTIDKTSYKTIEGLEVV